MIAVKEKLWKPFFISKQLFKIICSLCFLLNCENSDKLSLEMKHKKLYD